MDAKERLRRYLEQRRELGESEMVLDSMPVDDVMTMLGALRGTASPSRAARGRATTADGGAPRDAEDDGPQRPGKSAAPSTAPSTAPDAPPPAPPTVRFEPSASTDWRETLRRSGAVGSRPGAGPDTASPTGNTTPVGANGDGAPVPVRPAAHATDVPDHVSGSAPAQSVPAWLAALDLPVGVMAPALRAGTSDGIATLPSLESLVQHIAACARCGLAQGAKHAVPGEGNAHAELLCVGEAPGANEDEQGRPFVGEAGQLLTKILGAIQLTRDDVYICNVLKHRPPGNRDPLPDEVLACHPYLTRQLELVQPRIILALGRFAAQTLLQTTAPISALRGKVHRYGDIPVIVTYHPAALLRNEAWKRPTWEDVKLARRILDASRAARSAESA